MSDDLALTGGVALSVLPIPRLQLQLLVGASKPRGTPAAGAVARLAASFDF